MTEIKTIICLANSRKPGGRCVAGIALPDRHWVRPVGNRPSRAVSLEEQRLGDGGDVKLRDAVNIGLIAAQPEGCQSENWLLEPTAVPWEVIGQADWAMLSALEENPASLWIDGYSSSRGENDRVPGTQTAELTSSLVLIRVDQVELVVVLDDYGRQVRARFQHAGTIYSLVVTDPLYEVPYRVQAPGSYQLGESFLTISLTPPYADDGTSYKLVAGIIENG